nr:hypothetical protein [uncultured archaeon]
MSELLEQLKKEHNSMFASFFKEFHSEPYCRKHPNVLKVSTIESVDYGVSGNVTFCKRCPICLNTFERVVLIEKYK